MGVPLFLGEVQEAEFVAIALLVRADVGGGIELIQDGGPFQRGISGNVCSVVDGGLQPFLIDVDGAVLLWG